MQWFPFHLSKKEGNSIEENISSDDLQSGILVRWEKSKNVFGFGFFESPQKFATFLFRLPEDQWTFHEVFRAERGQKPRFDLDCEVEKGATEESAFELRDQVIAGIISFSKEIGHDINITHDLVVCSSHRPGEKYSFHIIVRKFCVLNHAEAKHFSEQVKSRVDPKLQPFIDNVCKPNQNLRVLGSHKEGAPESCKIWEESIVFKGQTYTFSLPRPARNDMQRFGFRLSESLVTSTYGCTKLAPLTRPERPLGDRPEVSDRLADAALRAYADFCGYGLLNPNFPFEIFRKNGNVISLKRRNGSIALQDQPECPICGHAHQSQNPYLIIRGPEQALDYSCRRAQDEGKERHSVKIFDTIFNYRKNPDLGLRPSDRPPGARILGEKAPEKSASKPKKKSTSREQNDRIKNDRTAGEGEKVDEKTSADRMNESKTSESEQREGRKASAEVSESRTSELERSEKETRLERSEKASAEAEKRKRLMERKKKMNERIGTAPSLPSKKGTYIKISTEEGISSKQMAILGIGED